MRTNIYTFYMPGEERFFFKYFHGITFAFLLMFSLLGVFTTKLSTEDAIFSAFVFVLPLYGLTHLPQLLLKFRKK